MALITTRSKIEILIGEKEEVIEIIIIEGITDKIIEEGKTRILEGQKSTRIMITAIKEVEGMGMKIKQGSTRM